MPNKCFASWASPNWTRPLQRRDKNRSCSDQPQNPPPYLLGVTGHHVKHALALARAERFSKQSSPTTRSTRVLRACALDLCSSVIQEVPDRGLQRNLRAPIGFGPYLSRIPKDLWKIGGTDSSRVNLDVNGCPADRLEFTDDIPETDCATRADVINFTGSAFVEQCNIGTYHIANVSEVTFNINVSDHEFGRAQTGFHFGELLCDRRQYEARRFPWAGM